MRLFTGLDLPPEVVDRLDVLLSRLKPTAKLHWSPLANLHITTKFIGEWSDERQVIEALRSLPSRPPIAVRIHNVGFFPNPHSPRSFWCGIDAPGLEVLAADTDSATTTLGIASEKRAFSPHLTLARIKGAVDLQPLRKTLAALESQEFGSFEARSFFLYRSVQGPAGSVYTKLAEFPLTQS